LAILVYLPFSFSFILLYTFKPCTSNVFFLISNTVHVFYLAAASTFCCISTLPMDERIRSPHVHTHVCTLTGVHVQQLHEKGSILLRVECEVWAPEAHPSCSSSSSSGDVPGSSGWGINGCGGSESGGGGGGSSGHTKGLLLVELPELGVRQQQEVELVPHLRKARPGESSFRHFFILEVRTCAVVR
jgi:hypothetical protein